ncbi:MAG: FprA family A-type flavoprotein [Sedimentisphaerales bacterium]|nr:FprA family A-type flavoprotein [Sedimentisphaerales bacterium]
MPQKQPIHTLKPDIHSVGAIDWDRRMFDALIPLPDGTSYNAYLIRTAEKTVLLDTVDPAKTDILLDHLAELQVDALDYVVSHHAEQDHSGSLPAVLKRFPGAKVVTNEKCRTLLLSHLDLSEQDIITRADGESLDLGSKTLQFLSIPWVHWPETLGTYLVEDRILFPCDLFGSHLATTELLAGRQPAVLEAAKRYYAEIMMPFRGHIKKHLAKLDAYPIDMIAPSHGPVYDDPSFIMDAYRRWSDDAVKNKVVVLYVTMHDSTERMVRHLADALAQRNLTVQQFDLSQADLGEIAMALVEAATVVIGSPTVLAGAHPAAAHAAFLINALRPKTRFACLVGSYGWGGKMVEQITGMLGNLKVQWLEPVLAKGTPGAEDLAGLDRLADAIRAKHQETVGIVS